MARTKAKTTKRTTRRAEVRRNLPKPTIDWFEILGHPDVGRATSIVLLFIIVVSGLVIWSREQVRVRDGQIMRETALKRLDYRVPDEQATEEQRQEARDNATRIYRLKDSYLNRLEAALLGLPPAAAGKTELAQISDGLRQEFELTVEGLAALQPHGVDAEPTAAWRQAVDRLVNIELRRHPLIDSQEYQIFIGAYDPALMLPNGTLQPLVRSNAIEIGGGLPEETDERIGRLIVRAGFARDVSSFVLARVRGRSTLEFDEAETTRLADLVANAIAPVMIEHSAGDPLYKRGDVLTPSQYDEVMTEARHYRDAASIEAVWIPRLGIIGLVGLMTIFVAGFAVASYRRLARNAIRISAMCILMGVMVAVTIMVAVRAPVFTSSAAMATTLFVAVVTLLAYDQRLAMVSAAMQAAVVSVALEQSVGWFVLLLAGCGAMVAMLREVRNRNSLIRAATAGAIVLAAGTLLLGLYQMPMVPGMWSRLLAHAGFAAAAAFSVGFLVLGILPSIERLFDITTGMTLAELRDPKQPLLRQLQQKAPGSYNHSLQVANICEAAADAIGADGLLVYVGSLYHDIGKLNKPEYFIENQAGGFNRHDKLSPAMSLLVIIGHVKDGIELAREYGLPRKLIHFIESHHGTTLVEYFYHAAREQAEADEKQPVDEVVFRYPGPKPRTREGAILMLADAVESATRAMAEPNPSRIESLVKAISRKRLEDGQFDECPLTFRELSLIGEAIISRLCAIHHGRISYPTQAKAAEGEAAQSA